MDMDFEKTLAMLGGQSPNEFTKSRLQDADRQQIDDAIEILFSGLALQKWLRGGILRDAWERALDVVRATIFEIQINNPATSYAREAVFFHRRKWHVKIMYATHANETISCPENKRDEWAQNAATKIQNGLDMLQHKITEFETADAAQRNTKKATENIIWKEIQLTRENEHVREREK